MDTHKLIHIAKRYTRPLFLFFLAGSLFSANARYVVEVYHGRSVPAPEHRQSVVTTYSGRIDWSDIDLYTALGKVISDAPKTDGDPKNGQILKITYAKYKGPVINVSISHRINNRYVLRWNDSTYLIHKIHIMSIVSPFGISREDIWKPEQKNKQKVSGTMQ